MLRKRLLGWALIVAMVLSLIPTALAAENDELYEADAELYEADLGSEAVSAEADAAMQDYLDSLEPLTIREVDVEAPTEETAEETAGIAMLSAAEPAAEHTPGVVLFSVKAGTPVAQLGLENLGITDAEPIFAQSATVDTDEGKAVWYSASCAGYEASAVAALKELPGVVDAELDYIYYSDSYGEPQEVEVGKNWIIRDLLQTANKFWWSTELSQKINPGDGTVVAVIDTGVDYTHEDLKANMWVNDAELNGLPGVDDDGDGYIDDIYGVNVLAKGQQAGDPMDDNGHGTHVAGIIAMSSNGRGGVGLAWGAKVMAIKAGQSTGTFTSADIAKAIDYAKMKGADVINMSFGGTEKSYLVEQALARAFSSCVLVASAGNDGLPTTDAPTQFTQKIDIYPAGYPYVLGVMATGEDGKLADFSNWDYYSNANCEYELTAPGVGIFSTLPGNRYALWSGTSMAAPCVSAAAAIVRSYHQDKDTYSSRFIMGQLASATQRTTYYRDAIGIGHEYAALDILQSCLKEPRPNINLQDVFALDNARTDNEINDADRIIDAGETIDLGFTVRNQWGQTGDITVTADAISVGGVANPYVEFVTPTVTLKPAGTFGESDNGNVWDDGYLTSVTNPITFRLREDTPNDTEICINLTATAGNGYDIKDTTVYEAEYQYTFTVQNGRAIRGVVDKDTTLSSKYYWIIENTVHISEGATLTVEPGTQIQFWSSDYEDTYGGKTMAAIVNDGTLNMIGTEDKPISCFPGKGFSNYVVEISGKGVETLKYCEIINPRLGLTGQSTASTVDVVDHCRLTQNQGYVMRRYLNGSSVKDDASTNALYVWQLSNSLISGLRYFAKYSNASVSLSENTSNCFNDCSIDLYSYSDYSNIVSTGTVFLRANGGDDDRVRKITLKGATAVPNYDSASAIDNATICTYGGSEHQYVFLPIMKASDSAIIAQYTWAKAMAEFMGGTLLCLSDREEEDFIYEKMNELAQKTRPDGSTDGINSYVNIGYRRQPETGEFAWDDGGSYIPSVTFSYTDKHGYACLYVFSYYSGGYTREVRSSEIPGVGYSDNYDRPYIVLELPTVTEDGQTLTEDAIREQLKAFDKDDPLFNYCTPQMTNCASLNPVLNTNPESWARITASSYDSNIRCYNLSGNYWGTENEMLINKMIVDADDFAGTLGDIVEQPTLTKNDDLSAIYPFVLDLTVEDADGNTVSTVSPGAAYTVRVTFNRDMDQTVQPTVTYGPDVPYTDFTVRGEWESAREWVGKAVISPVMTSGTQYFKTTGGRADSDPWLVCGNDILRYAMTVSTTGVQAMLLQASGGANKVELSWAQNDYDTLAGYNLYRSETGADGSFKKLNTAVLTDGRYTDTAVQPGKTYYYYFTVVNTEGREESARSNTASAAPIDNVEPVLVHTPVESARAGRAVSISATATDNIAVARVTLHYRKTGDASYRTTDMVATGVNNGYSATIPADYVTAAGVQYYITAEDDDKNTAYCGTAEQPNPIAVDGSAFITGITPATVSVEGGETVAILGGNFTEDMVLKVGSREITGYTLVDNGQITFTAPALPIGLYAVTLTRDGVQITSPTALSYTDAQVMAQIPTNMKLTSGERYQIPLYLKTRGEMNSFHAELDLGGMAFSNLSVEKADSTAAYGLEYRLNGSVVSISGMGSGDISAADGAPMVYINLTPSTVTGDQTYTLTLREVRCNGAAVESVINGTAVVRPNFSLTATVKYYATGGKPVSGVSIQAGGKSGLTDENGEVTLTGIPVSSVTVRAILNTGAADYITANDAALVLKYSVEAEELSKYQLLAADVDGSGTVNEHDAALILQMAVRKLPAFPAGAAWHFDPVSRTMTLGGGNNPVSFTAILMGDVDGSWDGSKQ